jgi:hypothetical protein
MMLASVMAGLAVAVTVGQLPATAAPAWVETIASGNWYNEITDDCQALTGAASGCIKADGDHISVADLAADGHSAAIVWQNFVDGALYRRGACVEKRGQNVVGSCNMNFIEGSEFQFKACTYESGASGTVADKIVRCGLSSPAIRV